MKTKTKKRLAGAAGILIILCLLLAVDAVTGDPLSRAWAEWRALHRAETLYPGQDFYVTSSYSGQFFNYGATVQSATSPDTRFDVTTWLWLFTEDYAQEQVENRWHTCYRMGTEGADEIAKIVDLDLAWDPDGAGAGRSTPANYLENFPLDAPFEPSLLQKVPSRICLQVLWNGTPTREDLDRVLHTLKQVLEQNDLPVTYYDVALVPMDGYSSHEELLDMVVESGTMAAADIA